MVGTHVDHGSELGERQIFVQVLLNVLGDAPESARGEAAGLLLDLHGEA